MAARDPMPFEGLDEIPDPAAGVADRSPPEVSAPTEPSPTRADRRSRSILLLALAAAWVAAIVRALGVREDIRAADVALPILMWVVLALAGLGVSLRPRARGLPPTLRAIQAIAVAVPLLFLVSALATSRDAGSTPISWKSSGVCMLWANVTVAVPLLLAGLLLQRSFLSAPVWRGAAVGAVCGLCAAAGIHAHCPMTASAHVLLAHGFPIAVGSLVGAIFGALRGKV